MTVGDEGGRNLDASIIVALGGNLAAAGVSVRTRLERTLAAFPAAGMEVVRRSRFWCSRAWPHADDPPFLNLVMLIETRLDAEATLQALHDLEAAFARVRVAPNDPRTVDLDLIAYGRRVQTGALVLPHPRAAERLFVMGPLAEIAAGWRHPVSGRTAAHLARSATVGCDAAPLDP